MAAAEASTLLVEPEGTGTTRHGLEGTSQGHATFHETVVTIAKTCMGTGTLALAFAGSQGGLLLNTMGLCLVAAWNVYAMQRLSQCLSFLEDDAVSEPPQGTTTFGRVAWHAFGPLGLHMSDLLMISLLAGILVAYQDAIVSFLQGTPLTTGSFVLDTILTSIVIAGIATVPNMGYFYKVAAAGLIVLGTTFVAIACYGGQVTFSGWHLWPKNGLAGASHWFGCVVFSYGVVPLTYNFHEGMAEPQRLVAAASLALSGVAIAYIVIGCGLLLLYPAVSGDIMGELPTGVIPTIIRLAFVTVIVLNSPLLLLPCGQLVEGKIVAMTGILNTTRLQGIVRFTICIICMATSIAVPAFVVVLGFVGCFSMSIVGFVFPPLFFLWLSKSSRCRPQTIMDILMLLWGVATTVISTTYTVQQASKTK